MTTAYRNALTAEGSRYFDLYLATGVSFYARVALYFYGRAAI